FALWRVFGDNVGKLDDDRFGRSSCADHGKHKAGDGDDRLDHGRSSLCRMADKRAANLRLHLERGVMPNRPHLQKSFLSVTAILPAWIGSRSHFESKSLI